MPPRAPRFTRMNPAPKRHSVEVVTSLADIPATTWNSLAHGARAEDFPSAFNTLSAAAESESQAFAAPAAEPGREGGESSRQDDDSLPEDAESTSELPDSVQQVDPLNPFISHEFLLSLEQSGSVGGKTGWTPLHLVLRNETGVIKAAMPLYAKSHSRGEYVFDHAFADALHRAGGQYYPKLQASVPFTPATARKLLVSPEADAGALASGLLAAAETLRQRIEASSVHATFLPPADRAHFEAAGYLLRTDQQFHFHDAGYGTFDGFLEALASRKRKVLRRERREALAEGITVEWLTGKDLNEAHWDAFFQFYMETGSRKWGSPYLTRAFFSRVSEAMADRILLVMAKRAGRYIAGALNFIGGNTLYGRNWGAIEHHPFLHFELCYYQAIDFALARGLARVEAGAQGEHKLARGYRPVKTWSAHRFADPGLHRAVADYLRRERHQVDQVQTELESFTPFRRDSGAG